MNSANTAKIFGWLQFALTMFGSILAGGIPHGVAAVATAVGSLATAVGVHAASSTDGQK